MSKLQFGDKILANVALGLNKTPRECEGMFLSMVDEHNVQCRFNNGEAIILPANEVHKFTPLSEDDKDAKARERFSSVVAMVKESLAAFYDDKQVEVEVQSDDLILNVAGWLSVAPERYRVRSILGVTEVLGWEVGVWQAYQDTRHEPGGIDMVHSEIIRGDNSNGDMAVARKVLEFLYNNELDHWFGQIGEERAAAEWAKEEHDYHKPFPEDVAEPFPEHLSGQS